MVGLEPTIEYHMKVPHWPLCYITQIGSEGGNRTPTNGFGDRRTAIILPRNYLVDRKRIELLPEPCKGPVLPLSLTAQSWRSVRESNPSLWRDKPLFSPMN